MDRSKHEQTVSEGINALHEHFDQFRHRHKTEGDEDAEEGAKKIQNKLEEVESRVENKDFAGALSGVESLRATSHKLERHDESFEWYEDPMVDQWVVQLKTSLQILDQLEYDG